MCEKDTAKEMVELQENPGDREILKDYNSVILISPRNETVTSYLLNTKSASPHFHHVDKDDIVSACRTYYEKLRVEREERGCWK
uniref:Uncharacterized protein n=1 Tax=Knipowitschia caucasica TaxID=637954 RepID=A0AAV2M4D8_KNICA